MAKKREMVKIKITVLRKLYWDTLIFHNAHNVQFNNSRENKSFVASGMFEDVKDLFQKNR